MTSSMPPRLVRSELTGRVFVLTDYFVGKSGTLLAKKKYEVTDDFKRLVNEGGPSSTA